MPGSLDTASSQEWGDSDATPADYPSYGSWKNDFFRPQHHPVSAHLMSGETHFPTAMSYISDAQRSDVATVCSGSVAEDIEVESVLSQEDHHPPDPLAAASLRRAAAASASRVVEFARAPPLQNQIPNVSQRRSLSLHNMGPPLNRTLLLQRKGETSSSRPSSVRSFGSDGAANVNSDDCGGSLDVEAHSEQSHEDAVATHAKISQNNVPTPASSVKSFGSQQGESDTGAQDTDDCGGSLDVETHSVGARSIHSQEYAPTATPVVVETQMKTGLRGSPTPKLNLALVETTSDSNGRRSPGGTIYKGRGVRRYKGRYMHLPLKRFHQNGINLDSVEDYDHRRNYMYHCFSDESWGKHSTLYANRQRRRSRSRSRSPEKDCKLPARRENGYHRRDRNERSPSLEDRAASPPPPRFRKNGNNGQYDNDKQPSRGARTTSPPGRGFRKNGDNGQYGNDKSPSRSPSRPRFRKNGNNGQYDNRRRPNSRSPKRRNPNGRYSPPSIDGALRAPRNGMHHSPDRRRRRSRSRSPVARRRRSSDS